MTLRTALSAAVATPLVARCPWPFGALDRIAGLLPKSPDTKHDVIRLTNVEARLVRAPGVPANTGRVILYLHGGAFLVCGANTHHSLINRLSKSAQAPVLAVNYRMIPNSLRDGIDDCVEAYKYLRRTYEASQIVLAGDSAGGYMAMSLAVYLAGIETPGAMVLLSPLLQLDPKGKRAHANASHDAMFSSAAFDTLISMLKRANFGELYEPLDHLCTVMDGSELPPTMIHVSGDEVLLHDAILAAEMMTDLDASVDVTIWPGQIHVFQIASALIPEARRSLDQLGRFIIEKTSEKVEVEWDTHRTAVVG